MQPKYLNLHNLALIGIAIEDNDGDKVDKLLQKIKINIPKDTHPGTCVFCRPTTKRKIQYHQSRD